MLLEPLADLVALALKRLAPRRSMPRRCDPGLDIRDHRVFDVEVAAVAGADTLVPVLVVERRRIGAGVDLPAQLPAFLRVEEAVADVELDGAIGARRKTPDARRRVQLAPTSLPIACPEFRALLRKRNRRLVIRIVSASGMTTLCGSCRRLPIRALETVEPSHRCNPEPTSSPEVAHDEENISPRHFPPLTAVADQLLLDLVLRHRPAIASRGGAQRQCRDGNAGACARRCRSRSRSRSARRASPSRSSESRRGNSATPTTIARPGAAARCHRHHGRRRNAGDRRRRRHIEKLFFSGGGGITIYDGRPTINGSIITPICPPTRRASPKDSRSSRAS